MDFEAQEDELLALSSIYEEDFQVLTSEDQKGGQLALHLDLPQDFHLYREDGKHKENSQWVSIWKRSLNFSWVLSL